MSDLISREETISYIEDWKEVNKYYHPYTKNTHIPIDEVIQVIKDVPSNNQKTGHWILPKNDDGTSEIIEYQIRCSECGLVLDTQTYYELKMNNGSNYCCRCGAKMEGE